MTDRVVEYFLPHTAGYGYVMASKIAYMVGYASPYPEQQLAEIHLVNGEVIRTGSNLKRLAEALAMAMKGKVG